MSRYVRPPIDTMTFVDNDGQPIDYGLRGASMPPDEAHTSIRHPERFAPLHVIADALIAHLETAYDVEVTDDLAVADDLVLCPAVEIIRAVRIRPRSDKCAPLTLVYTDLPGIFLHAGVLHDFPYPPCSCDACDFSGIEEVEDLERQVLAIAHGNYWEGIDKAAQPWVGYAFNYADGKESGRARADGWPAERVDAARRVLERVPLGWAAWPRAQFA